MTDTWPTRFTELVGCRLPLQQAGMGAVAGTVELAVAVADAGALGMVALPYGPADAMGPLLDSARARTDGVFGVNFLMPFVERDKVEIAAQHARLVEFFYAHPDPTLVDVAHRGGALAVWQVGSADEAQAAIDAGCDIVVAQGTEAGGHVRGTTALLPLLDAVRAAIGADVPLVAAGGIGNGRAMAAALAAGADAVRVGTRFLAAPEADTHADYLAKLAAADANDTVLTTAFSVMWPDAPHRVLRSAVEEAEECTDEVVGEMSLGDSRVPVVKWSPPYPTSTTTGHIGAMALYAGESVADVRGPQSAADIVEELVNAARRVLAD